MLRKLIILVIGVFLLALPFRQVSADLNDDYKNTQEKIEELEKKIDEARGQQKTLSSTIAYLDNQIELTKTQIGQTEEDLTTLGQEIATLSVKISRLDVNLDEVSTLLVSRVGASYRRGYFKPMYVFLSSGGFNEFFESNKYLQVAQTNDRKILLELQNSRDLHQQQKNVKETKQAEVEQLQLTLQSQKITLASQQQSKTELLELTKNDEAKFQELKAKLQADLESIARALSSTGSKIGSVNKGERIAGVGNSGCSTGNHLHFEVMKPAHVEEKTDENDEKYYVISGRDNKVDPLPYFQNNIYPKPTASYTGRDCTSPQDTCYNGDITTKFGQWYFLGYHTGLDVADYYGAGIYSAASGTSYLFSDSKSCYLTGTVGKGLVVDHDNEDVVTLYWHIP